MKENSQSPDNKLKFLEALRGLAALYVVIHHARWLLWMGYSKGYLKYQDQFDTFDKVLMYFFSIFVYGHQMVLFFFVLSGFVIHLRYSKNLATGNRSFHFQDYFLRRLKRIFPPLVFAILLTFILDSAGKYYNFSIYGTATPFRIVKDNFDLVTLLGNLVFLMDTYVETWGSNFALWSLKFEWWFYMLYPLLFFILKRSAFVALLVVALLYIMSFYTSYWPVKLLNQVFSYMLIWWFGVFLADIYTRRVRLKFLHILPLALIIPALVIIKPGLSQQVDDTFWGLGFAGVLAAFFHFNDKGWLSGSLDRLSDLGKFSFSLYVTHVPILVLMSGFLLNKYGTLPLGFGWVFSGTVICIAFAFIIHPLVETPFLSKKSR